MTKASLRQTIVAMRRALSPDDCSKLSHSLFQQLISRPDIQSAKAIAAYSSFDNEVSVTEFIVWALAQGKRVALPYFQNDCYDIAWIQTLDDLKQGKFGIMEPTVTALSCSLEKKDIDIWLVPGVAFTREGRRLGYGKGFYDRLLLDVPGKKLGMAYPFQLVESLPQDSHDIVMDEVVSFL